MPLVLGFQSSGKASQLKRSLHHTECWGWKPICLEPDYAQGHRCRSHLWTGWSCPHGYCPPPGLWVSLPLPSQLELSWQALTTVLGEYAGHGVQTVVPCLLTIVLQKQAQHGRGSGHLHRTWGGGKEGTGYWVGSCWIYGAVMPALWHGLWHSSSSQGAPEPHGLV